MKPHSKTQRIAIEDNEITIYCTQEPIKGKVNKEITKQLTELFHKRIGLISGFRSKDKVFLIVGGSKTEIETALKKLQASHS